ncbi:DUF4124 domain-containing protein [Oceanobacter mangrovi]|uniref:DUF4124 domain-containing protein n=1 Tax=Oceanobacter mangrovi TaxID=2862510 RepID=UPI001C8E3E7B|nr:DUF4124 domain-containing protein [Oceanobacter mangrovi]
MMKLLSTILLLAACLNVHAGIYKWTDENGNVHFGEQPPANVETTQMTISNGQTSEPITAQQLQGSWTGKDADGDSHEWIFHSDGTAYITSENKPKHTSFRIEGRYSILLGRIAVDVSMMQKTAGIPANTQTKRTSQRIMIAVLKHSAEQVTLSMNGQTVTLSKDEA